MLTIFVNPPPQFNHQLNLGLGKIHNFSIYVLMIHFRLNLPPQWHNKITLTSCENVLQIEISAVENLCRESFYEIFVCFSWLRNEYY